MVAEPKMTIMNFAEPRLKNTALIGTSFEMIKRDTARIASELSLK
jgi:hypothetical protein